MQINQQAFEELAQQYYSFSYALLPDEMMASQLIVDAISRICLVLKRDEYERIDADKTMVAHLYELGKSRVEHGQYDKVGDFYHLDIAARSCLFLREKLGWRLEEICDALNLSQDQVLMNIYYSRSKLLTLQQQQRGLN